MTFQVIHAPDIGNARSPFRVIEQPMGREVEWVNRFLDREYLRRLAETAQCSWCYSSGLESTVWNTSQVRRTSPGVIPPDRLALRRPPDQRRIPRGEEYVPDACK